MQLWTEYEGVTIDGAFPLYKLLLPEGRSAFFSTAGPKGEPRLVRLIECHFDEEEILARWRCIEALDHPNFIKFEHYGQIELVGGPVVYAVVEQVDANLAEVLDQGHLTVKDVAQLASSLVAALDVLHTHGFIHEHIEPRNIFAVGDTVKLRSDCIREAPEGQEGRAAKQRDVRDLATVLLQALTQRQSVAGIPDSALPPPFGQMIRNGLDGTWGLENLRAALEGSFGAEPRTAPKPVHAPPATPAGIGQKPPSATARPSLRPQAQLTLPLVDGARKAESAGAGTRKDTWSKEQGFTLRSRWAGAVGVVAVLLLLSTWLLVHTWDTHRHSATQAAAGVSQSAPQSAPQSAQPISASSEPVAAASPRASLHPSASSRTNWRVIAFTYNRRTDAEKMASSLARIHPDLQSAVFAPSGHAPYLVSIGGLMDREAAYALARRSRSLGLPHDTYAQNYSH
jgi:eukaryotic-like serine/threonine-protein kinase